MRCSKTWRAGTSPRRIGRSFVGIANDTDALVRAGVERRRAFDGFTLVEVPERRDFWFGNALVLDREPAAADRRRWIDRHAELFAGAPIQRHVIVWEIDGERDAPPAPSPRADGALDRSTVFVRREPFASAATNARPAVREMDGDAAWAAAAALAGAAFAPYESPAAAAFDRWRFAAQRDDARAGRLRAWGFWDADELVGFAGIYASATAARFATPVTHVAHRGRGVFRTLATVAVNETLRAHPQAFVAICAATGEAPAVVYRKLGFTAVGEQYGLVCDVRA